MHRPGWCVALPSFPEALPEADPVEDSGMEGRCPKETAEPDRIVIVESCIRSSRSIPILILILILHSTKLVIHPEACSGKLRSNPARGPRPNTHALVA